MRCRDCGHEYLLAYSCKRRHLCTSCHTMRAVAFAEPLHTTVLWPVAGVELLHHPDLMPGGGHVLKW